MYIAAKMWTFSMYRLFQTMLLWWWKLWREPIFPYSDVEDEYYDDQENLKWDNDYPLIKIYNEEHNKWDDKKTEKYEKEEYLRNCPLCRK